MSLTKQKLISLIIKKQSYKQLKTTITQIAKQNTPSVKHSVSAILQILTKEYNAEAKLYALRFLKDCFEAGSKQFIKSTSDDLLPVITNIVVDSTDQQAITKYAGSSFTKSTDLEKFKSIMVSFFKLAKECLTKWAEWVSNPEFKFAAAYSSLVKKGIRFDGEMKYFRPQNDANFNKNCKQNGFPLIVLSRDSMKASNEVKIGAQKSLNPIQSPKNTYSNHPNARPVIQQLQLSKRHNPKTKNKYVLKCHQIFKSYDQRLKSGILKESQLEQMNNQINSQLQEYMGQEDLNQTQMESELTVIFQNVKNVKEDFAKLKTLTAKSKENAEVLQGKGKQLTIAKTEQIASSKKIEPPQSPIHQLNVPGSQSPRGNTNKFQQTPLKEEKQKETIKQKPQGQSLKKVESPKITRQVKVEKKIEVFQDDTSIIQSEIKPNPPRIIANERQSKNTISSSNRPPINTENKISQIKSPKNQEPNQIQRSVTKTSNKTGSVKERFDTNNDISRSESSRVNFSESSGEEDSSYDQGSRLTGNFRKQRTEARLSSIIEEHGEHIDNSSRRHFNESSHGSSKRQAKSNDQVIQKLSLKPNQVKIPKQAIDEYETKIKVLQNHLKEKESRERELQKRLTELNTLKRIQEEELQKMREENNKILERFSNAVDPEQYSRIKKDFEEMKLRNKKMEGNMDRLTKEIQTLKVVQKQQSTSFMAGQNKENQVRMMPEPNNLFQDTYNIPPVSIKKTLEPQKTKFTYHPLDPDYAKNSTHLSKLGEFLNDNNLTLLKKNIIGASELFFNSEEISFICRMSPFQNQHMSLNLSLSFKFNGVNKKDAKPTVNIANLEEIEVWKKPIIGENFLYHQEIVVKLKNFPFKLLKLQVSTSEHNRKSVVLPFVYFSFLRRREMDQEDFDRFFSENKESAIKSKVFSLNSKVVKDFKSLHFYQGFSMSGENRMCFRLYERSDKNSFWCEMTNLARQKCMIKVIPEPYNEEMYTKGEELVQNLIFLVGGN